MPGLMQPNTDPQSTGTADPIAASPQLPIGSCVNERGHLVIGGCDTVDLAREFGTPAYVYAEDDIRSRIGSYVDALGERSDDFEVLFASKAAPFTAAYRICGELGLSIDVASGGELHTALHAGIDPARIYLHGNNKTESELRQAIAAGVGQIVCDSFDEIERLDSLLDSLDRDQQVLVRVTPGIKADTHSHISTGQIDSKFGFGLAEGDAVRAIDAVRASRRLELTGLHAHIGSQIFELEPYTKLVAALAAIWGDDCRLLNLGGGLGIAYGPDDAPPSIDEYIDVLVAGVRAAFGQRMPKILVEPGRSLFGNAGITLYTVGTIKPIPGIRTYVAVDGGMSDNMRPMLYGARYSGLLANRAGEPADTTVSVAGMHCESSDIILRDAELPEPRIGDILATPATGAYGHAMASNYNGVARPPVIFCRGGIARLVVRRETFDDLVKRDVG